MRFYLLIITALFFSVYAWKDWFKSLCVLIFMMALVERPDMPKQMLDIPGLNPWNFLFINVLLASLVSLGKDKLRQKLPPTIRLLLLYYCAIILMAFFREIGDLEGITQFYHLMGGEPISQIGVFQEDTFNTFKYAVPGILLFYACNSKVRLKWAMWTLLAMNFFLALQIIKVMPIGDFASGYTLEKIAIRRIDRDIGYYRSDLAILLGGAAWAIYCAKVLTTRTLYQLAMQGASLLTLFAVALTGGRIGMWGSIIVGSTIAFYKWRRILIIGPLLVFVIISLVPSIRERFTQGFDSDTYYERKETLNTDGPDFNAITSGRNIVWPVVIDQIWERPFFGHGRRGMQRYGVSTFLKEEFNEPFPHPHNAYLELFLDNGFFLGIPILIFYLLLLKYALQLIKVKNNPICEVSGCVGISFILSFLVGAIGQQSFYPSAGSVSLWCAIGILVRVHVEYFVTKPHKKLPPHGGPTWVQTETTPLLTIRP